MGGNTWNSIYCFPLVLEFYSPVSHISLSFTSSSCLSSRGGACCFGFPVSCLGGVTPPLVRGMGLRLAGLLCGFYSLVAFFTSAEGQNKTSCARISGPELQDHGPSSVNSPSQPYFFSKPSKSNHLHFCVQQTHRLSSFAPTAVILGRSPRVHEQHFTLCLQL